MAMGNQWKCKKSVIPFLRSNEEKVSHMSESEERFSPKSPETFILAERDAAGPQMAWELPNTQRKLPYTPKSKNIHEMPQTPRKLQESEKTCPKPPKNSAEGGNPLYSLSFKEDFGCHFTPKC